MTLPPARTRPRIFYGWYIVAAATAAGFVNLAVFNLGQALFVKDVSEEFMWSVTAISIGFSLRTFEHGILAPIGGYLIDRFGARTMAVVGVAIMFVGLLNFTFMHELWQFYLSSVTIALGQGLGGQAYLNPVVHWFLRKRGRASSIIAMGRGWSYIGILPISLLLVAFGWRTASLVTAIFYLAIALPAALALRDRPEPYGYLPDGDPLPTSEEEVEATRSRRSDEGGFGLRDAMRTRAFWMIMLNMAIYSYAQQTYSVHFLSFLRFAGFSPAAAALVQTGHGVLQVVGRLAVGWVADRTGPASTMRLSQFFMAAGWGVMAFLSPATMWVTLPLYYATFGLGHAAYTVTSQTIVADYFGPRRFATIRGMMNPVSVIGGVLGPVVAGLSQDRLGSYAPAFFVLVPLLLIGAAAITLAGQPTMSGERAGAEEATALV